MITPTIAAPIPDPMIVRAINGESLLRFTLPCLTNGIAPPTAINTSPNMFVATAVFSSIPSWNITGTTISELLPVITPIPEVTRLKSSSSIVAATLIG